MKESKQFKKMAKMAEKSAAATPDSTTAAAQINLAEAFRAQAEVLKKQKAKKRRRKHSVIR